MKIFVSILVVLLALGAGAYIVKTKLDAKAAELAACVNERDEHKSKLEHEQQESAKAGHERDDESRNRAEAEKALAEMQSNLDATRSELEELRQEHAEAEHRMAAFQTLTAKLQKMIDTGKLKVLMRGGRMIVKLPAEVLFASGKAELSPTGQVALKEVGQALKSLSDRKFLVAGHTDSLPVGNDSKYKDNWELSSARAVTVTEFLIGTGMKASHLAAAGYAEFSPVADNRNPAGRQENRRIEIVLQPKLDELPRIIDAQRSVAAAAASASAAAASASAAPPTVPASSSQ